MRRLCQTTLALFLAPGLSGQRVFEVEPNDSAATAQVVAMGSQVDASLASSSDADWFRFTSTGGNVRMVTNGAINTQLELWDGTATTQLAFSDDARGAQSDLSINLAAGTYYCRIDGFNTFGGAYSLDIGEIARKPFTGVEVEPNNSLATAQRVFNGAQINAALDANQFLPVITASTSVAVTNSSMYQLTTGSWPRVPQVGNILTFRGFANPANNGMRQVFAATADTISVITSVGAGPLVAEAAGASVTIDAGDEDWYQMVLPTQSAIWLQVSEGENSCIPRSRYEFYDAAGVPIALATLGVASGDGTAVNFRQSQIRVFPAGTYYVVIKQSNLTFIANTAMSPFGNYRLELLVQPMLTAGIAFEAPEPNHNLGLATPLIPGQTGIGRISARNGADPSDWWGPFFLGGPSVVTFQTMPGGIAPLFDSMVHVRDAGGAILFSAEIGNLFTNPNHARATVSFDLPITFYLDVMSPSNSVSGDYQLEVSSIDPLSYVSAGYTLFSTNPLCGPVPRAALLLQFANETPLLGTTFSRRFGPTPPSAPFLLLQGLGNLTANGGTVVLPYSLAALGAPNCTVNVDPIASMLLTADPSGTTTLDLPVPPLLALRGMWVFEQGALLSSTANALGVQMTNTGRMTIGERWY